MASCYVSAHAGHTGRVRHVCVCIDVCGGPAEGRVAAGMRSRFCAFVSPPPPEGQRGGPSGCPSRRRADGVAGQRADRSWRAGFVAINHGSCRQSFWPVGARAQAPSPSITGGRLARARSIVCKLVCGRSIKDGRRNVALSLATRRPGPAQSGKIDAKPLHTCRGPAAKGGPVRGDADGGPEDERRPACKCQPLEGVARASAPDKPRAPLAGSSVAFCPLT